MNLQRYNNLWPKDRVPGISVWKPAKQGLVLSGNLYGPDAAPGNGVSGGAMSDTPKLFTAEKIVPAL